MIIGRRAELQEGSRNKSHRDLHGRVSMHPVRATRADVSDLERVGRASVYGSGFTGTHDQPNVAPLLLITRRSIYAGTSRYASSSDRKRAIEDREEKSNRGETRAARVRFHAIRVPSIANRLRDRSSER